MLGAIFTLGAIAGLGFALLLLFLPAVIAQVRRHPNAGLILLVNLFFGWTFVGWIVALVWACSHVASPVLTTRSPAVRSFRVQRPVGIILPPSATLSGRR